MKKIFFAIVFSLCLTACGKYEKETITIEELGSTVRAVADIDLDDVICENLMDMDVAARYGISPEEIEGGVVYRSTDMDDADELILVKAKKHDFLRNVEMALESELNDITAAWKYDREEREKVERHILKSRGMYVLLAVTDEPKKVEKIFDKLIEEES